MPRPTLRTSKRVSVRTPGGRIVKHRVSKKAPLMRCAVCKCSLQGTTPAPRLAKSVRKPSRTFAGTLCASCVKRVLQYVSRVNEKFVRLQDVPLRYRNFVKQKVEH